MSIKIGNIECPPSSDDPSDPHNSPIHSGSTMTKGQLLSLVAAFYFRHTGTTFAALSDMLTLLNFVVPGCIVGSLYHFKKIFFQHRRVIVHFYCPNCQAYMGSQKQAYFCSKCRSHFTHVDCMNQKCYFLTSPIADQLRQLLETSDLFRLIKNKKQQSNSCRKDCRGDIVTGDGYRDHRIRDFLRNENNFSLSFSTDGIQVFNSSSASLWPIFCTVNECNFKWKSKHSILQGLWFGKKPKQKTFLRPFVLEARRLFSKGFAWVDKERVRKSRVLFLIGILDAPARAAFLCRRQWNGKCGCGWCYHPGDSVNTLDSRGEKKGHTRSYPITLPLPKKRTASEVLRDGKIASKTNSPVNGVLDISWLHFLPRFDVVTGMIPDSMHCVYLGVTKMFLDLWTSKCRQKFSMKKNWIDKYLNKVKVPLEISRTYRCLEKNFSDWKASELRNFLLFYSAPVLQKLLPDNYFKHWMLLVNFMRILAKKVISNEDLIICKSLAVSFAREIPRLYGKQYVKPNVHFLQHIVESAQHWGAP